MENWRMVWRQGIAHQLSTAGLQALERGLVEDDERLMQGATTSPPPLACMKESECMGACPIGYAGMGDGLDTVGQVEDFFAKVCFEADMKIDEPAGCRWFLNWFDDAPRDEARRELLNEVRLELENRLLAAEAAAGVA